MAKFKIEHGEKGGVVICSHIWLKPSQVKVLRRYAKKNKMNVSAVIKAMVAHCLDDI